MTASAVLLNPEYSSRSSSKMSSPSSQEWVSRQTSYTSCSLRKRKINYRVPPAPPRPPSHLLLRPSQARGELMREIPATYWNSSSKAMNPQHYPRARSLLPRRSPTGGSRKSLWIPSWTSGTMMRRLERIPGTLKLDLVPLLINHITGSSACVYSPTRLRRWRPPRNP